jgi:hypothetical protein
MPTFKDRIPTCRKHRAPVYQRFYSFRVRVHLVGIFQL